MIKPLKSLTLKNDNGEDTTYVVASAPAIVETTEPASVASFADGAEGIPVKSLIADITPVQNLNGQSAPYPAGGGKNKLPITATTSTVSGVTFTVNADGTISTSGTASAGIVFNVSTETLDGTSMVLSGCPSGGSDSGYYMTARIGGAWSSLHDTGSGLSLYGTVDRVAIVVTNGTNMNGKTFSPMVRANGTDPSYTPYSNICPITGWTGMQVSRTGKNILDPSVIEQGTFDAIGPNNVNTGYISVKPNTTYTVSVGLSVDGTYIRECLKDKSTATIKQAYSRRFTFTTDANTYYVRIMWYVAAGISAETVKDNEPQFEFGSTATTYEPYNGTTYPISWADEAGTVYGGTLDVTTGLLTVTHGIVEYDGSADESWTKGGGANECYIRNDAVKRFLDYRGQLFCDKLATYWHHATFVAQYGISAYGANDSYPSQNWLYVHLTDTTLTVADLKTWLQSNPITVCYPLATPQTYQLTPQAVLTILGQNNIWADTGDVEAAYCADTKLYIDKVIAAL